MMLHWLFWCRCDVRSSAQIGYFNRDIRAVFTFSQQFLGKPYFLSAELSMHEVHIVQIFEATQYLFCDLSHLSLSEGILVPNSLVEVTSF